MNTPAAQTPAAPAKNATAGTPKAAGAPKAAGTESAEKYTTMVIGIGKTREDIHDRLCKKADELGLKVGHLVWAAVDALLKTNPKPGDIVAPASVRTVGGVVNVGSAPGFWTVPTMKDGKAVGIEVVEVAKRPDAQGREFYRYTVNADDKAETTKLRERAKGQAIRGAKSDLTFLGLKGLEPVFKPLVAKSA